MSSSILWLPRNTFDLKYRDTHPTLRVRLRNPDGQPHDLTGALAVTLHIRLAGTTTVLSRDMDIENVTEGIVTYQWLAADWIADAGPPVVVPLAVGEHEMEYEVTAGGDARASFPNTNHDRLRITEDLGQTT